MWSGRGCFFAFLSAASILLSLPMQALLLGHLMHCSQFIISLDISSQGVLHIGLSFQLILESNEDLNARYGICSLQA